MIPKPRAALARITPYVPGRSVTGYAGPTLKLSSNENPLGAGSRARQAAAAAASRTHLYPDGGAVRLKEALARRLGVGVENLIIGCGSDEIIRLLGEAYLDPGAECLFADVTFSQYAFATRLMDARESIAPLKDGVHDLEAFAERLASRPRLCFICNPNNPTGTYVTRAEVEKFLGRVPPETLVVFDEAYFEYVDASDFPDACEYVRAGLNVVSLRTFSKIHGLAGLRVGYGVAPPHVVEALERVRPPFNVNVIAHDAALAALEDEEHVQKSRAMNARERVRLFEALRDLGLEPLSSQANFVFVALDVDASAVYEALMERGVIVRNAAPFGRPDALRITVGTPEQNDRVIESMRSIVKSLRERGTVAR